MAAQGVTTLARVQSDAALHQPARGGVTRPGGHAPPGGGQGGAMPLVVSHTPIGQTRGMAGARSAPDMLDGMPGMRERLQITGRMVAAGFWGHGPPPTQVYKKRNPPGVYRKSHVFEAAVKPITEFRRYFERGDIPISVRHGAKCGLEWKVEPEKLDYMHYLPIFMDGLVDKTEPFSFLALQGVQDMLRVGRSQVLAVLPQLIVPIRRCLNTRDTEIVCKVLGVLQLLVQADERIGEALVPYYRQLLPIFNMFKQNNANLGDGIDYAQRKRTNMGDMIHETLTLFEKHGGEDAFINIKYMIPTYESCVV
jgi:hypothetical protein